MTNTELEQKVRDELSWDPRIDNSEVAVSADNGTVTLRGTTHTLREKIEANRAARRVRGVVDVLDQLQARIRSPRSDNELRGAVLQALMLDELVPSSIDAVVADGRVTLEGTAFWQYQCDEADQVASKVPGVVSVEDQITLVLSAPPAPDIREAIIRAFRRNARLVDDDLDVEATGRTITISGAVKSWAEHDAAMAVAWAAPGVSAVRDDMVVAY